MADKDIVGGMFGITPEMYQQASAEADIAAANKIGAAASGPGTLMSPTLAPFYTGAAMQGQMLAKGIGGLLGAEDPQLSLIRQTNQLVKQIGVDTPEKLQTLAGELQKLPGGATLAMQAIDKANSMMKTGAEAQTAKQKIDQEKLLRDELAKLGDKATDEDYLRVYRKFGSPDQQAKAIELSMNKKLALQAKLDAANEVKAGQNAAILDRATNTLAAVSDASKLVGYTTAGAGSVLGMIPGTDARTLQTKLETVKANLAADMLADMKSQSKTGASGLGALNKEELRMLQSARTSLDPTQSPDELRKSLEIVNKYYSTRAGLPYKPLYEQKQEKQGKPGSSRENAIKL